MSNFRNVLKVYSLMRAFDADDNALLNTLRGASEPELELLRETLAPTKGTGKGLKKVRKPSKSPRAASLAGAIATRPRRVDDPALTGALCQHENCGWKAEDLIHDPAAGYAGYHPFTPAAAQAASGGD